MKKGALLVLITAGSLHFRMDDPQSLLPRLGSGIPGDTPNLPSNYLPPGFGARR